MHEDVYGKVLKFKKRNKGTIAWRLKAHSKVIEKHLNPGEEVVYAFAGQKGFSSFEMFNTYVIVVTNKRLLLAQKRVFFGYLFLSVTPDMFNDLTVSSGIIWSKVIIDTIKEVMTISNISKSAVSEIETAITETMMNEKKKYVKIEKK
jgi:hypothetical protein